MRAGVIPFGYAYLEGQLVKDPREYKTLLQIQKLWKSGKSCSDIAAVLNNQKTPTRRGKRWGKSVIARILKRQEEQKSYHKDDLWDLTYMSVMYGNQKIEIASSDNAKIFNRLVRKWQVQLIDYQLSNRSQLFDTELFIMPLDQLLAYKSMLGRDVDLEDIKDITGQSM